MQPDYFENHKRARQFPWSLYHLPLERDLDRFLDQVVARRANAEILVIGCGLLHELDRIPSQVKLHIVDIDQRAVQEVQKAKGDRIASATVVRPDESPSVLGKKFDAVYAKEVIEHVSDPLEYLRGLRTILKPGGTVWLSTPNYGEPWLPVIESTFLEAVARLSGYTRRGMHPSKFSRRRLVDTLRSAGFAEIQVSPIAARLALVAHAAVGTA